jgi:HEAT repeat
VTGYWELTPQQSIDAECARRGKSALVEGCIQLIRRQKTDVALVMALAGPAARVVLDYDVADEKRYWLRVWGARGLLWAWDDVAIPAIGEALADPAWRVREMAAKVIAKHVVGEHFDAVAALREDSIPRVAAAATRAVTMLTEREA